MKCRRINPENGMVIWFGVKEPPKQALFVNEDVVVSNELVVSDEGKTIFQNPDDKHDNYADKAEAVTNSLRQWLSVIKHELWYDYEYGIPLIDKVRSKAVIDAYIVEKIMQHPDVIDITDFESRQTNNFYTCYFIVNTIYGQIELGV